MKMKRDEAIALYSYVDSESNATIYPTTFLFDRLAMVLKDNLYTLQVAKVIKRGMTGKDGKDYIIVTYFLERATV